MLLRDPYGSLLEMSYFLFGFICGAVFVIAYAKAFST